MTPRTILSTIATLATLALGARCPAAGPANALDVSAEIKGKSVVVKVAGRVFTCYKFAPDQKYPYFFPVNGPVTNKSVTTETSEPYPHHHSLFLACDRVSGGNYWQDVNDRGQIISQGPRILEAKGKRVVIEDTTHWRRPEAPEPFSGKRTITISAPSTRLRLIDFQVTLTATSNVHIEKTNHALFAARMAPHMSGREGGRLVNAQGDVGEKATFGTTSAWCDYSGNNEGTVEGLAILDWPHNRWSPCRWFTREYGFFSPNPFYWLGLEGLRFAKGDTITLKFRVVVHQGNEKDADIAGLFKQWTKDLPTAQ
jgi:hypothetical protein